MKFFPEKSYIPLLCWVLFLLFCFPLLGTLYSPDSYAYQMLGDHMVSGQGYWSSAIRENVVGTTLNARIFPPLFPLLCGMLNAIFSTGMTSGVIVDLLCVYGIFVLLYKMGLYVSRYGHYVLCLSFLFFLLMHFPFVDEAIAGRSIPFATFLILSLVYVSITAEAQTVKLCVLPGAILGSLYLTRFDTTLFCGFFPLLLLALKRIRVKQLLVIYIAAGVVVLPWLISNYLAFGQLFPANQNSTVFSVYEGNCILDFVADGIPVMAGHVALWIEQRTDYFFQACIAYLMLLSLVVLPVAMMAWAVKKCSPATKSRLPDVSLLRAITVLWILTNIMLLSLAKNLSLRYFSISVLLSLITLLLPMLARFAPQSGRGQAVYHSWKIHAVAVGLIVALLFYVQPFMVDKTAEAQNAICNEFREFVGNDTRVATERPNGADPLAYYCGWKTIYKPYNTMTIDKNFIAWKRAFNVDYMITSVSSAFAQDPRTKIVAGVNGELLVDISGL